MKFIIDAQLPLSLKMWLKNNGHDAIHTRDLAKEQHTTDTEIIRISSVEKRIIITKDSDFYHHYLIKGVPKRLLFITTGNIVNKQLLQIFEMNFDLIEKHFQSGMNVVELGSNAIIAHS